MHKYEETLRSTMNTVEYIIIMHIPHRLLLLLLLVT